jgi:hypothetical protein
MDPTYSHNILGSLFQRFFSQYGFLYRDIFRYWILPFFRNKKAMVYKTMFYMKISKEDGICYRTM